MARTSYFITAVQLLVKINQKQGGEGDSRQVDIETMRQD